MIQWAVDNIQLIYIGFVFLMALSYCLITDKKAGKARIFGWVLGIILAVIFILACFYAY